MGHALAIDTSTPLVSVALRTDSGEIVEHACDPSPLLAARPAHARELLVAAHALLTARGLRFGDLAEVCVGIGPGGYTGLRIGIASARGLATALDLPVRAVDSLAVLARGIPGEARLAAIDARRGELFCRLEVGDGEVVWDAHVADPEDVAQRLRDAGMRVRAAGDGALRYRALLESAGAEVEPESSPAHLVRGRFLFELAARAEPVEPVAVGPRYLREPDAEPRR